MPARKARAGSGGLLDPDALREKAIRLLARRERSRLELAQRLAPYCEDEAALAAVLDELEARGWLSESRFAAQLVRLRRPRAGAARIRQELAHRGVSREVIAEATTGLEGSDAEAAAALWRRRFGRPAADPAERERQLRYLVQRGFGRGVALAVLRQVERDAEDDAVP